MTLTYRIREIYFEGKRDDIVFEFEIGYELLSTFLSADVTSRPTYYLEALEQVLTGQRARVALGGNVCQLEVDGEWAKVYDGLAADGKGNWCKVETQALYQVIQAFCEKT